MRIFWSFSRQAFHNTAIYRFDFWLQLVTVWFMSYSVYWIWNSLYAQNPSSFEVSLEQMVTYGILGMAFETIFAPGKGPQTYIASQVQTGLIHSDLMKPIDFQVHMLARNFGETFFRFCALVIPSLVISYVFFDLSIPKHISTIVLFTISIVFGYLVLFSLNFLIGLLAIITLDIRSIGWAYNALLRFFSGQMVPLWLFPGVLVGVAEFLPFKSIYYTPLSIYIEKLSGISALKAIMFQLIWIIILFFYWKVNMESHTFKTNRSGGDEMGIVQIYLKLINISMKSRMQYRTDFLTGILGILVFNAINISLIGIIVTRFVHLNGWSIWELVFLYSLWILGHSIFSLLFWQLTSMEEYLINGTFDQFLTRPISPLVQLLGREIQYLGIGDAIIGILGITLAYYNLGLDWSFFEFIYFLVSVLSGTGIEVAIFWMIACISFWTGRSMTASTVLWRINSMVQQYPIDIFGKWFQIVVTGIIPVAFMNFYPSIALLGKTDAYDHPNWINYMSPIVAIVLLLIASKIWSLALKRYSSSGN